MMLGCPHAMSRSAPTTTAVEPPGRARWLVDRCRLHISSVGKWRMTISPGILVEEPELDKGVSFLIHSPPRVLVIRRR